MLISPLCLINMYKKTKEFRSENEANRANKHANMQKNNYLLATIFGLRCIVINFIFAKHLSVGLVRGSQLEDAILFTM